MSNVSNGDINNMNTKNENLICGVIEGFYGRPWTSEQRKDLFQKLKKWGMNSYVYAPKDDCKHRTNWRDLYTVEEAEHLTSLITTANDFGITFFYAISPGLDITYSNTKDISALKRKLEQVAQFGCTAFALLFDDIDPEMSEADKEVFQSFAHAQVSVTNDVFQHLNQPKFLLCPTQYCAARAVPNVQNSEYLTTLGTKLAPDINIMWTGPKVISRVLSTESIEEITEVLRRPPVIWDNIHANDYDTKRVFLGPYQGRSPDLIPKLRGVMTNPNCEFWANFVAIHTLAQWSRCSVDGERERNESVSSDIKLETECDDGSDIATRLPEDTYHPRRALKNAILEWLSEFNKTKQASGFITKPQILSSLVVIPQAAITTPIPTLPIVTTCIALTATTNTSSTPLPLTSIAPMSILPEICATVNGNTNPIVMNSLLSETKVCTEPMDCNVTPPDASLKPSPNNESDELDETRLQNSGDADSVSSSNMVVDSASPDQLSEENSNNTEMSDWCGQINPDDLALLCDLFYLPFEHGTQGMQLLQEFYWLHSNTHLIAQSNSKSDEVDEWHQRSKKLRDLGDNVDKLFQKLNCINNKELLHDLYPYVWEIRAVISTLNTIIKWTGENKISCNTSDTPILGNYTWFSKGWKESFMSGDQEPWVFRGGLTSDLQRLIPVESSADLFIYKMPLIASNTIYTIRPYQSSDKEQILNLSRNTIEDSGERLIQERYAASLLLVNPEINFIVEEETYGRDDKTVVAYAMAVVKAKDIDVSVKSADEVEADPLLEQIVMGVLPTNPSVMCCGIDPRITDQSILKRLLACVLAALKAHGSSGVFIPINFEHAQILDFYSKLGFVEVFRKNLTAPVIVTTIYLGRVF